jgi:hypothetical protein
MNIAIFLTIAKGILLARAEHLQQRNIGKLGTEKTKGKEAGSKAY